MHHGINHRWFIRGNAELLMEYNEAVQTLEQSDTAFYSTVPRLLFMWSIGSSVQSTLEDQDRSVSDFVTSNEEYYKRFRRQCKLGHHVMLN